jgi:hypothetical protein
MILRLLSLTTFLWSGETQARETPPRRSRLLTVTLKRWEVSLPPDVNFLFSERGPLHPVTVVIGVTKGRDWSLENGV